MVRIKKRERFTRDIVARSHADRRLRRSTTDAYTSDSNRPSLLTISRDAYTSDTSILPYKRAER